nr:restriction endonuclease subunit S [Enterococcus faecalis]
MKKAPRIRFRGFQEDWELCKLNNIYKKIRNAFVGTATPYYVKEGNFYLESNNIKDGNINQNTKVFINDEFYEKQKDKWLETEDIVMVQSGHVGHTAVIPKELNNTAAHALIMFQERKRETNPYFLNYQFLTDTSKRKLDMITTGNTIKHILASEMKSFEVFVCESAEENLISDFFRKLDDTIGLHQRKLDQLKELKKAYLQVMFPAKDETVPRMRFAYFEGEWELCKLGDFLIVPPKIKATIDNPSDLMTVKLNLGGVYSGASRDTLSLGSTIYYKRFSGQFIYGKQNFFNGSMAIIPKELHGKATSGDVPSFDIININKDYLFYFISRKSYWKSKEVEATGTGSKRIHEKTLQNFSILVPLKDEQIRISTFCEKIDDTITLHQNKLNQLKSLKKSYLQNMFI